MTLPDRLVLFDGDCAVCDRTVQFLLDRDPEGRLSYAPLQGPTGQAVLGRHPELRALDTLVFVEQEPSGERVTVHSHAVFSMLRALPGPWAHVGRLAWLPRPLTDLGYRTFAALRYRVFGKVDACRVPKPEEVARFLP
ncbi:MAG: DCC1-like thiol-disulfide oxidoreductase family protein [Myxococcota bacterium]